MGNLVCKQDNRKAQNAYTIQHIERSLLTLELDIEHNYLNWSPFLNNFLITLCLLKLKFQFSIFQHTSQSSPVKTHCWNYQFLKCSKCSWSKFFQKCVLELAWEESEGFYCFMGEASFTAIIIFWVYRLQQYNIFCYKWFDSFWNMTYLETLYLNCIIPHKSDVCGQESSPQLHRGCSIL